MSKVNVGRNVSRCLSFFAAFYNFDWTTFGVAEKLDSSSQTSGFIVRNKWQVEQKTQNIFKSREHTLKTVLRHFEGCWDRFLSDTLFIRLQKHWTEEKVHRLHFCETNPDKLPSSSSWLIHFWGGAILAAAASGRSDERATDRQLFFQGGARNNGRRERPQSVPSALYTGGLMWWSWAKWVGWQVEVNIRRVRPCPGHQCAGTASISKDPPLGTGTTQLYILGTNPAYERLLPHGSCNF